MEIIISILAMLTVSVLTFFGLILFNKHVLEEDGDYPDEELIAKDEFDIGRVLNKLTTKQKVKRLMYFYTLDEVLDVLGYGDGSIDKEDEQGIDWILKTSANDDIAFERIAEQYAIMNGNFEEAIARNCHLPL